MGMSPVGHRGMVGGTGGVMRIWVPNGLGWFDNDRNWGGTKEGGGREGINPAGGGGGGRNPKGGGGGGGSSFGAAEILATCGGMSPARKELNITCYSGLIISLSK